MCTALRRRSTWTWAFQTQIGLVAKNAGLWPSVVGGLLGGLWMVKIGEQGLWLFGFVQVFSIFGFAWLAAAGHHTEITSVDLPGSPS
jgi:PAT family beta-lactamase induction signal transducer AmpG